LADTAVAAAGLAADWALEEVAAALELTCSSTSRAAAEVVTARCTGAGTDGENGCAETEFAAAGAWAALILEVILKDTGTPEPAALAASTRAGRAVEALGWA
jgi:hypothetical protein